ncbi:nucleotidyltransferase family protein [Pseudonocardia sp. Cha107L01]|uniref:nucleotidyltransferase family protein n=1 Tax=Pseudonocardia sp. Cha107L01 TaxID=3457576 RepID=UPI00403E7C39
MPGAWRRFPREPLARPAWVELLAGAEHHRLTGLLLRAVTEGAQPTTPEQARQIRAVHRIKQLRVMDLERELFAIVELLANRGIDSRVLKGTAVAHLDYPDPALRSFIDLDVLVRARDVDRAVAAMSAAGFARMVAEPRPGFDRRFEKSVPLVAPSRFELDLHRNLIQGPWGLGVDLGALWDEGAEFRVAGRALHALSGANRFMHACYHASLGDWPLRLGTLRDVAEMLVHLGSEGAAVRRLAASWGAEAVVAAAVVDAERLLGFAPGGELSEWAVNYVPSGKEVSRLGLHTHAGKTFAAQAVATLMALPRLRDKAAYARALALPDTRYTAGRHSSVLARFAFAAGEVRRGRGVPM